MGKYVLFAVAHLFALSLLLKILIPILPDRIVNYYANFAYYFALIAFARYTFQFTKKLYLREKVRPDNKSVLITGCDSGFGHHLAKRLYSKGFHVFACCQFPSGPGAEDLQKMSSKRLQVLELDVTKDWSVESAVKFVENNLGFNDLWAVVNNAGIQRGFVADLSSIEDFEETLKVNALGPVRITKAFLPFLKKSKGRVVNITSVYGRSINPGITPYTVSKFAAVAFNGCLRQEIASFGIKVISVEPELFRTGMTNKEAVEGKMAEDLQNLDENIKASYGEKYLQNMQKTLTFFTGVPSPKLEIVVKDMERAVTLEHPDYTYKPRRNLIARLLWYIYAIIPEHGQDVIVKFFFYIRGLHKPAQIF